MILFRNLKKYNDYNIIAVKKFEEENNYTMNYNWMDWISLVKYGIFLLLENLDGSIKNWQGLRQQSMCTK